LDWIAHGNFPDVFGTLSVAIMAIYHLVSMGSKVVGALGGSYLNGDDLLTVV
jgi:hypothetical protein